MLLATDLFMKISSSSKVFIKGVYLHFSCLGRTKREKNAEIQFIFWATRSKRTVKDNLSLTVPKVLFGLQCVAAVWFGWALI